MNPGFRRLLLGVRHRIWYRLNRRHFAALGEGSRFIAPLVLTKDAIACGRHVYVGHHARIEGIRTYNGVHYRPQIIIEDDVIIQQTLHLTCAQRVVIGSKTAVGANVTITDIHHDYSDPQIAIEDQTLAVNPVFIGADCKIYNNAVILPGVTIGRHVTVGANSVVTRDIPPFSVAAGCPAKIRKSYDSTVGRWVKPPA